MAAKSLWAVRERKSERSRRNDREAPYAVAVFQQEAVPVKFGDKDSVMDLQPDF